MKRRIKINGFLLVSAAIFLAASPSFFLRSQNLSSLDKLAEIFGITFILIGQILRASSRGYKHEHSHNGNKLIQSGPYALVRNPMYLGIFLIGIGIVLILFKWWVTAIFLSVFIIRYIPLVLKEEKKLSSIFGQVYEDYRRKIPRFFPFSTTLFQKDIVEILPLKLSWIKREVIPILLVLLGTLFLESWEDIRNKGLINYLKEAVLILLILILFTGLVIYLSKRTQSLNPDAQNKSKDSL